MFSASIAGIAGARPGLQLDGDKAVQKIKLIAGGNAVQKQCCGLTVANQLHGVAFYGGD